MSRNHASVCRSQQKQPKLLCCSAQLRQVFVSCQSATFTSRKSASPLQGRLKFKQGVVPNDNSPKCLQSQIPASGSCHELVTRSQGKVLTQHPILCGHCWPKAYPARRVPWCVKSLKPTNYHVNLRIDTNTPWDPTVCLFSWDKIPLAAITSVLNGPGTNPMSLCTLYFMVPK